MTHDAMRLRAVGTTATRPLESRNLLIYFEMRLSFVLVISLSPRFACSRRAHRIPTRFAWAGCRHRATGFPEGGVHAEGLQSACVVESLNSFHRSLQVRLYSLRPLLRSALLRKSSCPPTCSITVPSWAGCRTSDPSCPPSVSAASPPSLNTSRADVSLSPALNVQPRAQEVIVGSWGGR